MNIEQGIFYAYVHCRPNGNIFYVGKGKNSRVYQFYNRTQHHKNIVKKYGESNILLGVMPCSTESAAFDLERGIIKCLRRSGVPLVNLTDGGEGVSGYTHPPEVREKMSRALTGLKKPAESVRKRVETRKGWKVPDDVRARISKALAGRKPTEAQKAAVLVWCKSVAVGVMRSDGTMFESIRDAERKTGVYRTNIKLCLQGKRKTAGGFGWSAA